MRGTRRPRLLSATGFSLASLLDRELAAGDSPGGMAKVPPCQRRSTLSAA